jgi:aryl-alcohol dehydrogenase (NADP+)
MTFGHQCNEEQSVSILNAAKDHGFTFIDTADVYPIGDMTSGYGATEEILGRWLTGQRDNFILATKCYAPTGPNKWDQGNSRKNIIRAAEESLRRLKTDYIDLYQLHFYDDRVSHDESLSALDDLVRSGKVRYIGCSNYLAYQLATALGRSDVNKWERFASVQPRYNMLFRENERELLPLCAEQGLAVSSSAHPGKGGRIRFGTNKELHDLPEHRPTCHEKALPQVGVWGQQEAEHPRW